MEEGNSNELGRFASIQTLAYSRQLTEDSTEATGRENEEGDQIYVKHSLQEDADDPQTRDTNVEHAV
jgi:hypothetical protein